LAEAVWIFFGKQKLCPGTSWGAALNNCRYDLDTLKISGYSFFNIEERCVEFD
jgi:hypothetical protein